MSTLNPHACCAGDSAPLLPPADLGQPTVNATAEGNSTAGEEHALVCGVETEEGVRTEDISIQWTGPDGGAPDGDNIVIGPLTTTGNVTTGRLQFSPLRTSDRGQYNCTGRIAATSVGVDVSSSDSTTVTVTSECPVLLFTVWYDVCAVSPSPPLPLQLPPSVPAPDVAISLSTQGTIHQGTSLTLTCTATVDTSVNTGFDVNVTWSSTNTAALSGQFTTVSDRMGSGHQFTRTVTLSPVDTTDSGGYTCTATATPTDSDPAIIPSSEGVASSTITVEG